MHIYPSILTGNFTEAQQQLNFAIQAHVPVVQLDVIDGIYADNITLTPTDYLELMFEEVQADIHLMTVEPMDYVHECIDIKDSLRIRSIISQVERMSSQQQYIDELKTHDWKVGMSLDLDTPFEAIDDNSWEKLDVLQLMSIRAGFQGQKFEPYVLEKLTELKEILKDVDQNIEIILDGGIKFDQLPQIEEQGIVSGVAIGSDIWKSSDPVQAMTQN